MSPKNRYRRGLYSYIDGYEDLSVILINCSAMIGPPLMAHIQKQRDGDPAFRKRSREFANQIESGELDKNKKKYWVSLSKDVWADDLHADLRELIWFVYGRHGWSNAHLHGGIPGLEEFKDNRNVLKLRDTLNKAHHGSVVKGKEQDVHVAVQTLMQLANKIGNAELEQQDLERIEIEIDRRAKWSRRHSGPILASLGDVTCAAVHWVQPKDEVPGSWSVVILSPDSNTAEAYYDQTTDDVFGRLKALEGPVRVGLAFCFSCPESELINSSCWAGDPLKLWEWCTEAAAAQSEFNKLDRDRAPLNHDAIRAASPSFEFLSSEEREKRSPENKKDRPFFRMTEIDSWKRLGVPPASFFDVGGSGSVGALAIKGMPLLDLLSRDGATIWPLELNRPAGTGDAQHITCVEIFPGALWTSVFPDEPYQSKKSRMRRRQFLLDVQDRTLQGVTRTKNEIFIERVRAFDALLTAWALRNYGDNLEELNPDPESPELLEGKFWLPTLK